MELRQGGDDVLSDAVREVLLPGVATHVDERQHGDRGLLGERETDAAEAGSGPASRILSQQRECSNRVGYVLHLPVALIGEAPRQRAAHGALHGVRNPDAAWLGERLKARGDVHSVAINRAVGLFDHIAEMHTDAKPHAPFLGHDTRQRMHFALDRKSGVHGACGRLKRSEHAIAHHVDDPALIRFDV